LSKKFCEQLIACFSRYDTERIKNDVSNSSSTVLCVFVTAETFLLSRCLAKIRGIFTKPSRYLAKIGGFLPSRCIATIWGFLPSRCLATIGVFFTEPLHSNDLGIFTEPLPSNDKGIFTKPLPSNDKGIFTKPLPRNYKGIFSGAVA
jgi:hypothetical protein